MLKFWRKCWFPFSRKLTSNFQKKHKIGFLREKFQVPRRSPVNSKLVASARNFFISGLRVHQSKLLGMSTGDQLPPTFCTGVLKLAEIAFCAESGALWRTTYYRWSECLYRSLLRAIATTESWKQITAGYTQKIVTHRWTCRNVQFARCSGIKFPSPTPLIMGAIVSSHLRTARWRRDRPHNV